jgi:D-ribose pyranase
MRADGLWHPGLLALLTSLGHTDRIVIADAGLPVPPGVPGIDLVWRRGDPPFVPVLRAVLAELVVERAVMAAEASAALHTELAGLVAPAPLDRVPHERFKELTRGAAAVVRTGEATPYANILLIAGVPF